MSASDFERYEIEIDNPLYPIALKDMNEPPEKLYVIGNPSVLSAKSIAVTGTRRPSPYGEEASKIVANEALAAFVPVITGGAVGCESVAARTVLENGGLHIAVVGSGADVDYPSSNVDMFELTVETGGAIVSISPWGKGPTRAGLARRRKVIAALSQMMVVVEAGFPSGVFSTAECAMELGREVWACPGGFFAPESRGCNMLIEGGAKIICDSSSISRAISSL